MGSTTTDRIGGLSTSVSVKAPVANYTTDNISLSGLDVQSGGNWSSALSENDRILVKDQTDPKENGIYQASTGEWRRALDFNGARDVVQGTIVLLAGSSDYYRVISADPIRFGTSEITFLLVESGGGSSSYDPITVKKYGAKGDGSTDDTSAFQAAIDALPVDGGEIEIQAGNHIVTTSSLSVGTKTVLWTGNGIVNGSTNFNNLPGLTFGINRNSITDPTGQLVLYREDESPAQGSMLRLRTVADYSSPVSGIVVPSLQVERIVGAGPGNSNWGALFDVTTDQTQANSRSLASYHKIRKGASSNAKVWGFAVSAINESTVDTQIVGCEINTRAIGSMGANKNRIGAQFIVSTVEDEAKADFEAIIGCVVNGTADGGIEGTTGDLTADTKYGIKVEEESPGAITDSAVYTNSSGLAGIKIDGTPTSGLKVLSSSSVGADFSGGTYSRSAIRLDTNQQISFNSTDAFNMRLSGNTLVLANDGDAGVSPSIKYRFDMTRSAPTVPVINSYQGNAGATETVSSNNAASFNGAIVQDTSEVSVTYSLNSVFTISGNVKRARITWNFAETTDAAAAIEYKISLNSPTTSWRLFGSPSISQELGAGDLASGIITAIVENTTGSDQTFELVRSANTSVDLTSSLLANKNAATIEVLEWA